MSLKMSLFLVLFLISCSKNRQVYAPLEELNKKDLDVSKNRAKQLNQMEREQISKWISTQNKNYYSTSLNYWSDIENLELRPKKQDGEMISFQYRLFDFDQSELYPQAKIHQNVVLGKFEELDAIESALRYLNQGEETILLVPSVLAYGTYGDGDKISHDMPLIIRLKRL